MNDKIDNPHRRRALFTVATAIATVPFIRIAVAQDGAALPHVTEDDPTAKALNYHHDATAAPRVEKAGTAASDQFCHNCIFAQGEGAWLPCQLFPGKAVNANGWCSSWTKKPG